MYLVDIEGGKAEAIRLADELVDRKADVEEDREEQSLLVDNYS